jgi:hypothetical protein
MSREQGLETHAYMVASDLPCLGLRWALVETWASLVMAQTRAAPNLPWLEAQMAHVEVQDCSTGSGPMLVVS